MLAGLYVALRRNSKGGFEMSVNGRGSANLHPVTVKAFADFTGMSERQAKYFRKGWASWP